MYLDWDLDQGLTILLKFQTVSAAYVSVCIRLLSVMSYLVYGEGGLGRYQMDSNALRRSSAVKQRFDVTATE